MSFVSAKSQNRIGQYFCLTLLHSMAGSFSSFLRILSSLLSITSPCKKFFNILSSFFAEGSVFRIFCANYFFPFRTVLLLTINRFNVYFTKALMAISIKLSMHTEELNSFRNQPCGLLEMSGLSAGQYSRPTGRPDLTGKVEQFGRVVSHV